MARTSLIHFALGFALFILEGMIDRPSAMYGWRNWLTAVIPAASGFGAFIGVLAAILVPFDIAAQVRRKVVRLDLAYYPRPAGLRRCLAELPARMFLTVGLLLLAGWLVHTQLDLMLRHALPPPRILAAGLVAWGILWLADCLARPKGGTFVAGTWFLVLALFIAWTIGSMDTVRE
jgi:hypothetical protein